MEMCLLCERKLVYYKSGINFINWNLNSSQQGQKKCEAKTVHRAPQHRSPVEVKDPVSGSPCKKHIPIRYKASSRSPCQEVLHPRTQRFCL